MQIYHYWKINLRMIFLKKNLLMLLYVLNISICIDNLMYIIKKAKDSDRNELVLSFRGTNDFTTILYDANFRSTSVNVGSEKVYVHDGMWKVATKLWSDLKEYLEVNTTPLKVYLINNIIIENIAKCERL